MGSRLQVRRLKGIADIYTPGIMTLDETKLCVTLEPGLTRPAHPAIPAGTYKLTLQKSGLVYAWMLRGLMKRATSAEEKAIAQSFMDNGIPLLGGVAGRAGVEIHIGNTEADSEGCTLLGSSFGANGAITGSTLAYYKVYPILLDYIKKGEAAIDYIDFNANA